MPQIGLKNARYNVIDFKSKNYSTLPDGKPAIFGRIIDEKFAGEYNSAVLHCDDILGEEDSSFKKGTLTITIADDVDEDNALFSGATITKDGEVTYNVNDIPIEFGYGHVVTKLVNKVKSFKVEFFPRCKVKTINTDNKTRGENVEFATTTVESTVLPLDEEINGFSVGDYKKCQTFDTMEKAISYLTQLLTPPASIET